MPTGEARPVRSWIRPDPPVVGPGGDIRCRILFVDEVIIDPSWRVQLGDPFWRLYLDREDGAWLTGTAGTLPIPAGRPVLVPAWCRLASGCRTQVVHRFVHFDPVGFDTDWVRSHCPWPMVLASDARWLADLESLFAVRDGSPTWRLRVQAVVLAALAEAVAGLDDAARDQLGRRREILDPIAAALAHIEEHLSEPLPIAILAGRCRLGSDHFARLFRERTGRAPARYVQERRVAAAAERLLATADDIAAIAEACGFANRFHFTRVFTAHMGVPPAAYRRSGHW